MIALLLLSACRSTGIVSAKPDKVNTISEDEIEPYVLAHLEEVYSVSFEIHFLSKEPMKFRKYYAPDQSDIFFAIEGAYQYTFEITDPDGVKATLWYSEPVIYTQETADDNTTNDKADPAIIKDNYSEKRLRYDWEKGLESIFSETSCTVRYEKNESQHDRYYMFVYSDDPDELQKLISNVDKYISDTYATTRLSNEPLYMSYNMYIVKDMDLFNTLDSETMEDLPRADPDEIVLQNIIYTKSLIANCRGFEKDVFSNNGYKEYEGYIDTATFTHFIFSYDSSTNSIKDSSQHFRAYGLNKKS